MKDRSARAVWSRGLAALPSIATRRRSLFLPPLLSSPSPSTSSSDENKLLLLLLSLTSRAAAADPRCGWSFIMAAREMVRMDWSSLLLASLLGSQQYLYLGQRPVPYVPYRFGFSSGSLSYSRDDSASFLNCILHPTSQTWICWRRHFLHSEARLLVLCNNKCILRNASQEYLPVRRKSRVLLIETATATPFECWPFQNYCGTKISSL
jgi:hypothetical protein